MKRIGVVSVVALIAAVLGSGYLPAQSETPAVYQHFIGALHEHSGYSDGFPGSRPAHYFQSAKAHGLDFLMSGEHSDNADVPMVFSDLCLNPGIGECAMADKQQPENSFRKWEATLEQARAATDDSFTGVRGFEWTSDRFGHINVYFSEHDSNAKADGGYASMETFWEWFARSPALGGGADGLATFNHPGDKSLGDLGDSDPAFDWNDFEYVAAADQRMVGIELYNDSKDYGGFYVMALKQGWHLGAIGAEDLGHRVRDGDSIVRGEGDPSDDWGSPKWAKTVIIATDRSEAALREAMLARRFYAVKDNSIRIQMSADNQPMGSRISAPAETTVPITASVNGGTRLELVTNGGSIVAAADGQSLAFDAPVANDERYYFLRVLNGTDTVAYSSPVWISPEAQAAGGRWLAGDLHIHTTYSHDSYGGPSDDNTGPEEAYTAGHSPESQFAIARARGLDYLAITDHNDIRSIGDFDTAGDLIAIAGYENSLSGHAQMLGAHSCYSDAGAYPGTDCGEHGDTSAAGVNATAEALRADGGVFQANHPAGDSVDFPHDADWGYGYNVVPDTVEVWNISRLWQPPMPSGSSNDDAISYWEGFLDRGFKVGATGGSDNHYLATTAIQGAGQPTTWVFAAEESEQGVLDGLAAGHTFISHQPPNHGGPLIFLEGDGDKDGAFESIVGDELPPGSQLRVRVERAPGSLLRVITDNGQQAFPDVPVTSPSFTHSFSLPADATWVRAEILEPDGEAEREQSCDRVIGPGSTYCRNKLLVLGMTSALYLGTPEVDPTPTASETPTESPTASPTPTPPAQSTLKFVDTPSTGQFSDPATFSAQLTDAAGTPLAGEELSFVLRTQEGPRNLSARTNSDGVATVETILDQRPGTGDLTVHYAGSERTGPSSNFMGFEIVKEQTVLALDLDGKGNKRELAATLSDEDSSVGIDGRSIDFYADETLIGTSVTGSSGRATLDVPARYQGGSHDFEARFAGDDFYLPISAHSAS